MSQIQQRFCLLGGQYVRVFQEIFVIYCENDLRRTHNVKQNPQYLNAKSGGIYSYH
jgi:hypothetical protein